MASAYLAADCQLVFDVGHRQLHSADWRTCHQADLQPLWRLMFSGCRPEAVEWPCEMVKWWRPGFFVKLGKVKLVDSGQKITE